MRSIRSNRAQTSYQQPSLNSQFKYRVQQSQQSQYQSQQLQQKQKRARISTQTRRGQQTPQKIDPQTFISRLCVKAIKEKMLGLIKKKELAPAKSFFIANKISPLEELSAKGFCWTLLHYCCYYDFRSFFEYLLKYCYDLYTTYLVDILSINNQKGQDCFMLCCIFDASSCMEEMIKCGGFDLKKKSVEGFTGLQYMKAYKSKKCLKLLKRKLQHYTFIEQYPLQKEYLDKEIQFKKPISSADIKKDPKLRKLLTEGERLPCLICLCETGYIMYTSCCGQPFHLACKDVKIKDCPTCRTPGFDLTSDIYFPERAFELPKK